jgi:hypothetical protein
MILQMIISQRCLCGNLLRLASCKSARSHPGGPRLFRMAIDGKNRQNKSSVIQAACYQTVDSAKLSRSQVSDMSSDVLNARTESVASKAVFTSHPLNITIYRTIEMMRDLPGYTFIRIPAPR